MHQTIELLVHGDPNVGEYYRRAVERWKEIWSRHELTAEAEGSGDAAGEGWKENGSPPPYLRDILRLAAILSDEALWFEEHCGNPELGQEIMAVSGLGMLYSTQTGFGPNADRARLLHDAFGLSGGCSGKTQYVAQQLARSYGLFEKQFA